jgi:hypothetical protein
MHDCETTGIVNLLLEPVWVDQAGFFVFKREPKKNGLEAKKMNVMFGKQGDCIVSQKD